ncbi:MAG: tetratricopeptide repeat protein [Burkholderiales bacterium]|nr:tetratricopeptide repeat protein [Burkholderiales bacterium]
MASLFKWLGRGGGVTGRAAEAAAASVKRGNAALAEGRLEAAAASYREAVAADAGHAGAWVNLGFVLKELGQWEAARGALERAVEVAPGNADARYLLGLVLEERGDLEEAIRHLRAAVESRPDFVFAWRDLCRACFQAGRIGEAQEAVERGLEVEPHSAELLLYRGNLRLHEKVYRPAIEAYQQALTLVPNHAVVHANLGKAYMEQGDVESAVAHYRRALALDDGMVSLEARSSLLFARSYRTDDTPEAYLAEAKQYGALLAARAKPFTAWPADTRAEAPLRVGLVSGDFLQHPVGYFLESILASLDPSRLELFAYPTVLREDALSVRIKPRFAAWHPLTAFDDAAAAARIRADAVQVLIDLSGHTSNNRLPLFAWKPAPVQVSWLGFFATTGVPGMDYLLADPYSVPESDRWQFIEAVWLLPDTRLCFTPPPEAMHLEVAPLPALREGHVCFGCFQNSSKINDEVLVTWGRILEALPQARFMVQNKQMGDAEARERFLSRCAQAGIDPARVDMGKPASRADYLAAHSKIDMIVDTFPYPGGTTTCEALWMGVPTLTLAGATMLGRQGAAMMRCVDLGDWVAADVDDYVAKAVSFAKRPSELAELRAGLRDRAARSPLFDAPRFARNLEEALLAMWRRHRNAQMGMTGTDR